MPPESTRSQQLNRCLCSGSTSIGAKDNPLPLDVKARKEKIRLAIWRRLEDEGVALFPKPIIGRIPNFIGASRAAENLSRLPEYERARAILFNPDYAQITAREKALRDGKVVIMASPRLKKGYIAVTPELFRRYGKRAVTIGGAFRYGRPLRRLTEVDLVVEGSVAVDPFGARLGKGGGYGDREIEEARMAGRGVKVVTLVHDLQVVDEIPQEDHDERVDVIVTPDRVIRCAPMHGNSSAA